MGQLSLWHVALVVLIPVRAWVAAWALIRSAGLPTRLEAERGKPFWLRVLPWQISLLVALGALADLLTLHRGPAGVAISVAVLVGALIYAGVDLSRRRREPQASEEQR